jgi:sugar phosphate isomerase/epimerase
MSMRRSFVSATVDGLLSMEELIAQLAKLGYDGVELLGEPNRYELPALRGALKGAGLEVTALTAACRVSTGRDLSSSDPTRRRNAREHFLRSFDLAGELGTRRVGVVPCGVGRYTLEGTHADEWQRAVEELAKLAEVARARDLLLLLEPLNRYTSPLVNTVDDAIRMIRATQSSAIAIGVDIFHMVGEERDIPQALARAGALLGNIQISDSNRGGIGDGFLNFSAIMKSLSTIDYSGPLALEAYPPGWRPFQDPAIVPGARDYLLRSMAEFIPRMRAAGTAA